MFVIDSEDKKPGDSLSTQMFIHLIKLIVKWLFVV